MLPNGLLDIQFDHNSSHLRELAIPLFNPTSDTAKDYNYNDLTGEIVIPPILTPIDFLTKFYALYTSNQVFLATNSGVDIDTPVNDACNGNLAELRRMNGASFISQDDIEALIKLKSDARADLLTYGPVTDPSAILDNAAANIVFAKIDQLKAKASNEYVEFSTHNKEVLENQYTAVCGLLNRALDAREALLPGYKAAYLALDRTTPADPKMTFNQTLSAKVVALFKNYIAKAGLPSFSSPAERSDMQAFELAAAGGVITHSINSDAFKLLERILNDPDAIQFKAAAAAAALAAIKLAKKALYDDVVLTFITPIFETQKNKLVTTIDISVVNSVKASAILRDYLIFITNKTTPQTAHDASTKITLQLLIMKLSEMQGTNTTSYALGDRTSPFKLDAPIESTTSFLHLVLKTFTNRNTSFLEYVASLK